MFRYIVGQAVAKQELEYKLSNQTENIMDHMLKIFLMPDHPSRKHWQQEIYSFINRVDRLKNTKKFPAAKQIYTWTYDKHRDLILDDRWFSKYVKSMCKSYHVQLSDDPINFQQKFDSILVEYFSWLAKELSDVGLIDSDDVDEEISKLIP